MLQVIRTGAADSGAASFRFRDADPDRQAACLAIKADSLESRACRNAHSRSG